MAPVAHAIAARGGRPTLVLTGQHPRLDPAEFGLGRLDTVRLHVPGEEDPHAHVGKVTSALLPLLGVRPDLLVVQGDTSSALGGALAGFSVGVPVAHVEAGLRTHDPHLPWPEEEYRVAIDAHAELLFAPTELAAANLEAEKVPGDIHITGNTGIDSLLALEATLRPDMLHDSSRKRILVTCHRRESWEHDLEAIPAALRELALDGTAHVTMVLHPNPYVAETMRRQLDGLAHVSLIEPMSHRKLVQKMRDSELILSDSGGIQEEAPALGTPLLVLREKTERPECLASGNAILVGTSTERIVTEAKRLLDDPAAFAAMSRRAYPFGDGKAGPRIAAIIEDWIVEKRVSAAFQG